MKYFTLLLIITVSTTSFSQWQLQNSGTSENLNDVAILNQTDAIVVGDNGTILKTSNNGSEWISINSGTTNHLNAVSFRDDQNGLAVGNGVLSRTTDGGESWANTTYPDNFITVSHRGPYGSIPITPIIIGSNDGKLLYSYDDGVGWNDTILFPSEKIIALGFNYYSPILHSPLVYIASSYYTGTSSFPPVGWYLYENPINPVWDILTGGEFFDWNQYLVGWSGNPGPIPLLLRRTDSYTTWESMYSFVPGPYIPNDIKGMNEILFVCGIEGKLFKSIDGGDNWNGQFTGITENLNSIDFINDNIGYCVGNTGTILFTSNGGGINSVNEIKQPNEIVLYQNYPNPFNPITNIEYKINSRQHVQLKVFDVLGNEITTLVNEEQPAGSYNAEFDPSLISSTPSSGIYFYQLSTTGKEGHSVQTMKMIYLK